MPSRQEFRVRDPYIVNHDGLYYLYVSRAPKTVLYYTSRDLDNWEMGEDIFTIPDDSWAYVDVWASEVHKYNGKFYLFVSLKGKNELRGTQVAVSDTPRGPFVPVVNGPITPKEQSCIDATLYVENDIPYVVYSHDWPDNYVEEKGGYVGELWAAPVDTQLKGITGEPFRLFASDESPISAKTPHHILYNDKETIRYGSDAPFLQKLSDGRLLLTWSPYLDGNYVVLSVVSASGSIRGTWEHLEKPLFDNNGGHAMFFEDFEGNNVMCIHQPESPPMERVHLYRVKEINGELTVIDEI